MGGVNAVICCSWSSGVRIGSKMRYEAFRAAIVRAGRFSSFEASATDRAAKYFTRLREDRAVVCEPVVFPWVNVRRAER